MEKQKNTPAKKIVRLDSKTTIILNNLTSFKLWQQIFPQAKILN